MTKFEFVLNKFYEITAWSLFAAVAMTVLNGDYDTVPASLLWQIPVLSFLGALSSLIYPWDRGMTRKEFVIRIAIHYLIMNGIVLGGGSLFGWFDIHEPLQVAMTVLNGDYDTVPASLLWQIPVLSFLGALSSLIYPWDRGMTRKEFVIRIAIHYLIMNGIVLGGGSLFGWFDIHEPLQVAMMALSVAIIFFIISLYSWTKGNREAQKLNQRLKKRNDNES